MTGRRLTTMLLQGGTCGMLLWLSACNNTPPAAPVPGPSKPQTTSKPPITTEQRSTTPADPATSPLPNTIPRPNSVPQIAQSEPNPAPTPLEDPGVNAPMTPRVVPQIAQQNLYHGGQLPQGMPAVALSEQHAKLCPIKVGQDFPNLTLADQTGKPQELNKLRGRYTLVVLWSASVPAAVEELNDLEAYAYQPYKNVGLNVVAVHTPAGKPVQPQDVLAKVEPTFPTLNDPNGELREKLGKGSLPRTFLLDSEGKVLWFDIEYSRETRRQLQQALQAVIREI